MRKFEYLRKTNIGIETANELGDEGWELVNVIQGKDNWYWIFKREIQ